jgi:magnesium transporter
VTGSRNGREAPLHRHRTGLADSRARAGTRRSESGHGRGWCLQAPAFRACKSAVTGLGGDPRAAGTIGGRKSRRSDSKPGDPTAADHRLQQQSREAPSDDRQDRGPNRDARRVQSRRALDAGGGVRARDHGLRGRAATVDPLTPRKAQPRAGKPSANLEPVEKPRDEREPAGIGPRARLYDATRPDRDVRLTRRVVAGVKARQLLWVDVDSRDGEAFAAIADILAIPERAAARILDDFGRAGLIRYPNAIHVTVEAMDADGNELVRRELDLFAQRNVVLTVHDGPVSALERFTEQVHGDSLIGELDAGLFLAAIIDTVLTAYFARVEEIERDIDRLDELALRIPDGKVFLVEVLRLRRLVAVLRRTIAPHREAFAPLARHEAALDDVLGSPQPGLLERLERVIDATENARELLVGSFDLYLGGAAQRTNDVMKVLTILSAVLLPGVVLAGIMGMNFQLSFFDTPTNFWIVIVAMLAMAVAILAIARKQKWI